MAGAESIVRDLRSANEDVRLKALILAGVPEGLRGKVQTDDVVVTPSEIELRYAALGSDATQQAILAVVVGEVSAFATVATPKGNGWETVARFDCWCKYDPGNVLDEFLQLSKAPDSTNPEQMERFELVLRGSGGGSGLYDQEEGRFRFQNREMKSVFHFTARRVAFHMGGPDGRPAPFVEIQRRWFHHSGPDYVPVLVEGHGSVAPESPPQIRDLEPRQLGALKCRPYKWNEKTFQYEPISAAAPCKPGWAQSHIGKD